MIDTLSKLLVRPLTRRAFRPVLRNRATIFMLHRVHKPAAGVCGHEVEFVHRALKTLRNSGAEFVPLSAMVDRWRSGGAPESNWIAFTFDDGFDDQADLIEAAFLPIGCPATVFLITGFLDGDLWPWDDQISYAFRHTRAPSARIRLGLDEIALDLTARKIHDARDRVQNDLKSVPNENLYSDVQRIAASLQVTLPKTPPIEHRPMSWDRVRQLERAGITFAPHSISHRIFSRISASSAAAELEGSWRRLCNELTQPLRVFAWPTGRYCDFSERDIELARTAGMLAAFATEDDYAYVTPQSGIDLYRIKRFSFPEKESTVLRYGSWLERARQLLPL